MLKRCILLHCLFFALFGSGPVQAEPTNSPSGKQLFREHCATCHGPSGRGGIGLPLHLEDFLRIADRQYLMETIKHGRPGRVMPGFAHLLTRTERGRIADFIEGWQKGPEAELPEVGEGSADHGAELFERNCAGCHGYKGQGGTQPKAAPGHITGKKAVVPPALNNSGFLAAASDAFIKATMLRGREGTPMRAYGGAEELTDQQMNDLVAYIRSWGQGVDPLAKPVIEVRSDLPMDELIPMLKMSINSHNFVFIRQQTLYEGLPPAAKKPDSPVHILQFCSFGLLDKALKVDERVGAFLPCQISVYREGGRTVMSAINPKALSPLFHKPELELFCSLVSEKYLRIMQEANF
ncbi:c-type cytochrome [Thiohalorhabdus methylotrophus]|uniref:C-type cytochrome n=1 Tax=Thiohalorhabdus methylotrophus TaxID=3242694 RepID=A0ABV4TTX5_9GAMM